MTGVRPYPLLMRPAIQARPWGGTRIRDVLGKSLPPELGSAAIGESWEVSAHPNGVSRISNGALSGMSLPEVHRLWGELLVGARVGARHGAAFPLLIKLIEVCTLASVQVHPNDEQALRLEGYPTGKSEAWYIIDAGPTAEAYIGFREGIDRARFVDALASGRVAETLGRVRLEAGDCALLEPGTVHACGNGILLLEVQQSCDITYRVYDWDRVDGRGAKRELHVDKSLEVMDFAARPRIHRAPLAFDAPSEVLRSRHFSVFEVRLRDSCDLGAAESFTSLTAIRGECSLRAGGASLSLRGGDTVLLPAGLACELDGGEAILVGASPLP